MDFSLGDDVLVAGTLGRGAWKISNVSQVLGFPPVLEIDPAVLWFILNQGTASDDSD